MRGKEGYEKDTTTVHHDGSGASFCRRDGLGSTRPSGSGEYGSAHHTPQTGVDPTANIKAKFSEAMKERSINTSTFYLLEGHFTYEQLNCTTSAKLSPARRLVVAHVVRFTGAPPLEGGDGSCRGVLDVDQGGDPSPATRDRQAASPEHLDHLLRGPAGAVEGAVAQGDTLDPFRGEGLAFSRAHRGEVPLEGTLPRRGERVVLGEDPAAPVAVAVAHEEGLRHEPAGAHQPRCSQQVGCPLYAERVGCSHVAVSRRDLLEGRHFVENRVGLKAFEGLQQCLPVHNVCDQRLGAERAKQVAFARGPAESDHLMTACDEGAHQWHTEIGRA